MRAFEMDTDLGAMLATRGIGSREHNHTFHGPGPDAREAWECFKLLAESPPESWLEDDGTRVELETADYGDLLHFEARPCQPWSEPWDFEDPRRVFGLEFTRQVLSAPEPSRNQDRFALHLEVEFALSPVLVTLAESRRNAAAAAQTPFWEYLPTDGIEGRGPGVNSSESAALARWIAAVEASESFKLAHAENALAFRFASDVNND